MKVDVVIFLFIGTLFAAEARIYEKCELVRDLQAHGFANLPDWVCLVEHESQYNSAAVGGPNTDGSYDYGLFQINSMYWCGQGGPGGGCNIACEALLSDDGVGVAAACVQQIFAAMGFPAWNAWKAYCQGQPLPDISMC